MLIKRITIVFAQLIIYILVIELSCQLVFWRQNKRWLLTTPLPFRHYIFEIHPYLVGVPRPGAIYTYNGNKISINSLGFRNKEISIENKEGKIRIVTLGGSTTFCAQVTDEKTWPQFLQRELGPKYEVINLGVPGYSSVENLIQTALWLSDLSPDIAIYYVGWNDIRNMHIKNLKSDYSNFHGKSLYSALNLDTLKVGNRSAAIFYLRWVIVSLFVRNPPDEYSIEGSPLKFTAAIDERALLLYERNIRLIIALCRAQNITPIIIPQILNYEILENDDHHGWAPFLRNKDVKTLMPVCNERLRLVCSQEEVDYISDGFDKFNVTDFVDQGHFSPSGTQKFANGIANYFLKSVNWRYGL